MALESTRDAYGSALVELARQDKRVVALECDLGRSTRSHRITEVDPARFIEMGIAEQDMISTAAGMASMGKIPFVNSFAIFLTGRAFDQIRQQISLPCANVKLCGSSAGLTEGPDGATHQAVLDAGLMRLLPNMVVVVPADGPQTRAAVRALHAHPGPAYLRLSRYETGDILPAGAPFELGKALTIREGKDVVIASCGPLLKNVLKAVELLEKAQIRAGVVNFHTLKPLDLAAARALMQRYACIVSVEEHSIYGGLGSALAEAIAEEAGPNPLPRLTRLGVQDTFGESGNADQLLGKHGLHPEGIADGVQKALESSHIRRRQF
jgi:transketolase